MGGVEKFMGWADKSELDEIHGVNNICDRIIEELNEEYPWNSIIRYMVEKLKRENGEK